MNYVKIDIVSNAGYDAQQAAENFHTLTVGQLREMLEGFDDDMLIVTYDEGNRRGACWGTLCGDQWLEEVGGDDE